MKVKVAVTTLRRRSFYVVFLLTLVLVVCISLLFGVIVTTISSVTPIPENASSLAEYPLSEYEERLRRIERVCRKYDLDVRPSIWKPRHHVTGNYCSAEVCTVVVNEDSHLMGCLVPKVACTTFKRYFVRLLDNETLSRKAPQSLDTFHSFADAVLDRVTPNYFPQEELDTFTKFMFVRHPFERIVSAFVDKALKPRSKNWAFYKRYWIPIMRESGRKWITSESVPTFREFVHYLLRLPLDKYTEHWVPFWRRCEPCKLRYDFVGKLETADVDVPYALRHHPVPNFPLVWNKGSNTSVIAKQFFAELNVSEIFALYTKYYLDFELFGYTIDEFIQGKDVRYLDLMSIKGRKR